jgi:apolipoprotein D and lipocalin family protein
MRIKSAIGRISALALAALAIALGVSACATIPKGAVAIDGFDKARYLGKWYEIARFDFNFERDLNNTTAEYALNKDGTISVTNRGFKYKEGKWDEAKGVARFRGSDKKAELEVSFFGPFFAPYNVIALDSEYKYALVAGSSLDYLWFLSREKTLPQDIKDSYLALAKSLGYDLNRLVWVQQDEVPPK